MMKWHDTTIVLTKGEGGEGGREREREIHKTCNNYATSTLSLVAFSISWIRGTAAGSPQRWSSSAEIPKRARVNEKPLVLHPNIWRKRKRRKLKLEIRNSLNNSLKIQCHRVCHTNCALPISSKPKGHILNYIAAHHDVKKGPSLFS